MGPMRNALGIRPGLLAAALTAAMAGVVGAPEAASAQDESNPAVFWRLEREREQARTRRPVVIQRPTRMTRGVAPRRGFTVEVPADSAAAAAAAAAAANNAVDAPAAPSAEAPPATPGLSAAVTPAAPAVPAGPPFVIAVFGDNVAQMLAQGVTEAYANRNVTVLRRARENTGLVREDYYDWPKAVQDFLASDQKVDLAIMMVGSNDRQSIREGGQSLDVLSDKWKDAYRTRALAIAESFRKKGVPLIWVGMTVMKNERLSADLVVFNEIYRDAAQKAGATYVDVWEPFVDERNRFTLSGPDLNGHVTRIRTGDGVHFTRAGARKLAHFIEGDVKRYLDQRAPAIADQPSAAPQGASLGLSPDALTGAPLGSPLGAPLGAGLEPRQPQPAPGAGGQPIPVPAPAPVVPSRPAAGPVVPLTASTVSPGGELATRPGAARAGDKSLPDGAPPESRAGRADDFRWPRQ